MTWSELIMSWAEWLYANWQFVVCGIVVAVLVLYGARKQGHELIRSLCRVMSDGLRLMAKSALLAEQRVSARNKEVLINAGKESVERVIEREFHRVDAVVKRDLGGFPVLQRAMAEQVSLIDEDYQASSELAPPPPEWLKAVEGVAKLPSKGDSSVLNILKEIHKTTTQQYKNIMAEYQRAVGIHHAKLNKLLPYWRKVTQTLDEVGKTITGIHERARIIDNRMEEYEQIRSKTDTAERMLTSSSLTQFFISGFALIIAILGAYINFHLIAEPMSEMVGAGKFMNLWFIKFRIADVAAMVIIMVEVAMGLYLMEALRITKLFPVIGHMDDRMRYRMIWITLSFLFILAGIESALAFLRDQIAADRQALIKSLGGETGVSQVSWIPLVGQMVMGFILPFALAFVAIPLESFVASLRTVIGKGFSAFLRCLAFCLRLVGNIIRHLGVFLINLYDVIIFLPLWIEDLIKGKKKDIEKTEIKQEVF